MLTRSCCCGGCFDVDDCPLPFGSLGDFTYTTAVDINQLAGTLASKVWTSISTNLNLDPVQCYTYAYSEDFCCAYGTPPNCIYPTQSFVEKYFDVMRLESVDCVRTTFPCLTVVKSAKSLPWLVKTVRCTIPKTVPYQYCDSGPPCPSPCAFGTTNTQIAIAQSAYAGRLQPPFSCLCGDVSFDLEPRFTFGALTKSGGQFEIKRNSQTTFVATQTGGTGPTSMTYLHRANICPGASQASCGLCTLGGNGGTPCGVGRCCCRSYLKVTLEVKRAYQFNNYVWNSTFNFFEQTVGPVQYETQQITLIYEGPVDERLYRVTGVAAQRTFTLLSGAVTGTFNLNAPDFSPGSITLDYCPFDVNGLPGQIGGCSTGGTTFNLTNVTDECQPCDPGTPPVPDYLSMEQLEALGIARNIIVTRQTP